MKKFIITALIAFLLGGFSITTNAQPGQEKSQTSTLRNLRNQDNKHSTEVNQYEKTLKGFESQVNKCLNKYNELSKVLKEGKDITAKNNGQQQKIEKLKRELDSFINSPNNGAKARRDELEKLEDKLNSDQKTRFKTAKNTLNDVISKFAELN